MLSEIGLGKQHMLLNKVASRNVELVLKIGCR